MERRKRDIEERFYEKVWMVEDGCWLWTGSTHPTGYGYFSVKNYPVRAHRWAYEQFIGPIPERLVLDHLCKKRSCVNPKHLEPVTQQVNTLRGDTVLAENVAKTHCIHGHEFTSENTYVIARKTRAGKTLTHRHCKVCQHIRNANRRPR